MKKISFALLIAGLLPLLSFGQMAKVIKSTGSSPMDKLVSFKGAVYFERYLPGHQGLQIFLDKTDGTVEGTEEFTTVSNGFNYVVSGEYLYYASSFPNVYRTDGTKEGIVQLQKERLNSNLYPLKDSSIIFFAGALNTPYVSSGDTSSTFVLKDINVTSEGCSVGNAVYFAANDSIHGNELWKTDGTKTGTQLVKDISAGFTNGVPFSSDIANLFNVNGKLFFTVQKDSLFELWHSDGSDSGTVSIKTFENPLKPIGAVNNSLIFGELSDRGGILHISDGTFNGTSILKGFSVPRFPSNSITSNNILYMAITDSETGRELWRTDGTTEGTYIVMDLFPGSNDGVGQLLAKDGNELFFSGNNGHSGLELWKTDGTQKGTKIVSDLNYGPESSAPHDLITTEKGLFVLTYENSFNLYLLGKEESSIIISSPADSSTFEAPADIPVTLDISGPIDTSASIVEFFEGANRIGVDSTFPYSITWSQVNAGTYSVYAKLTDWEGAYIYSAPITIIVDSIPDDPTQDILGPNCMSKNQDYEYSLNPSNKTNAFYYSWWVDGSVGSISYPDGDRSRVIINAGEWFIGGQVCVGVNYNSEPYYKTFCKEVSSCSSSRKETKSNLMEKVIVSPNPSTEQFRLLTDEPIQNILVTNSLGTEVFRTSEISKGKTVLFGNDFSAGIFYVTIQYLDGNKRSIKLIKQ